MIQCIGISECPMSLACWRKTARRRQVHRGIPPDRFCPCYLKYQSWLTGWLASCLAGGSSKLSNVTRSSFMAPGLIRQVIQLINDRRA